MYRFDLFFKSFKLILIQRSIEERLSDAQSKKSLREEMTYNCSEDCDRAHKTTNFFE